MVPAEVLSSSEIQKHMEADLISAAVRFSWDENKVYPLVNRSSGLKQILEQLASQAPANSKQVEFYATLYETYKAQLVELQGHLIVSRNIESPDVQKIIPKGTILSTSDKNLGPVLLPVQCYVQQYEAQALKGNHVATNMSADQCIILLKKAIEKFRTDLIPEEKVLLSKYFVKSNPECKVGVLKVIPKLHKLSTFTSVSWKSLPSRPIRGAETCPVNPYSKALCKMLQEMHFTLKEILTLGVMSFLKKSIKYHLTVIHGQ